MGTAVFDPATMCPLSRAVYPFAIWPIGRPRVSINPANGGVFKSAFPTAGSASPPIFFTEIKLRGSSEAITTYLLLRRTSTSHTQVRLAAARTGATRELQAWPYFVPGLTLAHVQIFVKAGNFVDKTKTKRFGRRSRIFHINPVLQNEIDRFEGNARVQNGISFLKGIPQ